MKKALAGMLSAVVLCGAAAPAYADNGTLGRMGTKLLRGGINLLTGWIEVPKQAYQVGQNDGALRGWTIGILKGLGIGFVRTAGGLYEAVTFPFPAPPDYAPIMQPPFAFSTEGASRK